MVASEKDAVDCPGRLRKVYFYDCKNHAILLKYEEVLVKSGAIIQDFRIRYKDERVEIIFTIECTFELFLEKLKKSECWHLTSYSESDNGDQKTDNRRRTS